MTFASAWIQQIPKMEDRAPACLFAFGVISDTQYADIDNRLNFTETRTRYYRNALTLLTKAVDQWTTEDAAARPDFVMQLGDVLDGFNSEGGKAESWRCLETVLSQFDRLPCPVHHLFGNHEFYNFNRVELMNSRLFTGAGFETVPRDSKCRCFPDVIPTNLPCGPEGLAAYYHFSPAPGFRIVVLDSYNQSIIGHAEECPIGQESLKLVRSVNKNELINSPAGLSIHHRRFVAFNGGLGEKQLEWLEEVLRQASSAKEKVIVFGHIPMYSHRDHTCLVWDCQEALKILRSFPCVVAGFSGHTHEYGYNVDAASGIHFVTFPGVVELPPGSNGFGTVLVYEDRLFLRGVGVVESFEMTFPVAGRDEPVVAESS